MGSPSKPGLAVGKPSRQRWPDTWEPDKNVTEDIRREYEESVSMVDSKVVRVDIKPLVQLSRKNLAQAVASAKTQCRARVVEGYELHGFDLTVLAEALLEVVRRPWRMERYQAGHIDDPELDQEPLPIITNKDSKGIITKEVQYTKIEYVAAFAAFESFLTQGQGVGCLRYAIGRDSNTECMVLGVPLVFKVTSDIRVKGISKATMDYVTCKVNGKFGTLVEPAGMKNGMMKHDKHFNRVLAYVKKMLPDEHPLALNGWKQLPPGMHSLPKQIAVPDGDSSDDEPAAPFDSSDEEGAHAAV